MYFNQATPDFGLGESLLEGIKNLFIPEAQDL
jgi:hypothetical protein